MGLGISFLLHLAVLILYRGFSEGVPAVVFRAAEDPGGGAVDPGLRLIPLVELPPGAEEARVRLVPLQRLPEPVAPTVAAPRVQEAGTGGGQSPEPMPEPPPLRSAAELFRPPPFDPRLLGIELPPLSEEERYRLQLSGRLQAWQDSVAAEIAREQGITDWTVTDAEGGRWGVSPGTLHLGKYSLPLPLHLMPPPGLRDELARRQFEDADIRRGAASDRIRSTWEERNRAIRERREAERADSLRGTAEEPTRIPPQAPAPSLRRD